MSPQTFHRFLELPGELQLEIWALATGNLALSATYMQAIFMEALSNIFVPRRSVPQYVQPEVFLPEDNWVIRAPRL